ncbi:phage tail sheath family protein [Methylogaea oryzae]|uniref:Tail protein n=1 Tax=Methylogaea oryzae TaxID=1295382 RepID=A0A8D4VT79_9GAMM|nr:phage tail sheath subtilisin-like domain-containing protein [Methylogaea oryzae]BBL72827.1 tail protein [Methylogaea oryzae]
MPVALSYPGVYVEEIPSGVRTITGVATSITAFVGRAARGPTNKAFTINGFGDFEKTFGGLWSESALGFAVRDFFLNGGGQAIIVRLYKNDEGASAAAIAPLTVGDFDFVAASEGKWGIGLRVSVDTDNLSDSVAAAMGVTKADLFNVSVRDTAPGGKTERFANVTVKDSSRRVDKVLEAGSSLLRYNGVPDSGATIAAGVDALSKAENDYAVAKKALFEKQNSDPANVATEQAAVTTTKTALDKALSDADKAVSDGLPLTALDLLPANGESLKKGIYALEQVDLFNLLCIPTHHASADTVFVDVNVIAAAAAYCEKRRAMLIVDAPKGWTDKDKAKEKFLDANNDDVGTRSRNAALFFPRLRQPNPLRDGQMEDFDACGAVAGIFARTDAQRGVWKAPAGLDATLVGVPSLSVVLTDPENGELNQLGINCLRAFSTGGRVVWGSRTLKGADQLADEYKYVPVRRTALYIEESLFRGLKWVVFEPNDEPLWSQIRLNVGAFMHNLFRQGAFQGSSPRDAYFVKCDKETTTQNDIDLGIVNVVVGFAPLKPAEFVVIKLQQIAGQVEV